MNPQDLERARNAWTYRGQQRPPFAVVPAEGQESVWDYPRPPAYVPDQRWVEVYAGEQRIARTQRAIRVLETGHPPAFYLPPEAVDQVRLRPSARRSFCEWKGEAEYFDVEGSAAGWIRNALWRYPRPEAEASVIAGWFAAYPSLLRCVVAGEPVRAQAGGFYGGWITNELVGPFKGEPGSGHW
ncbi:DUF427 domain-containing protein [Halochromatium roseum]|uniref:DUF427 domain-containing protein n=1 Tax=Halochromatium roseum TaxID=391920 RepID=UPI001913D83A|nr:DUF427 domain-containing protein [Halochromatium roseum]MBK5938285.1 hypothetical protein [Halochromatium roseum]